MCKYVCVVTAQIFLAVPCCGILCLIATFVSLHFFLLTQFDAVHSRGYVAPNSDLPLFSFFHPFALHERCSFVKQEKRRQRDTDGRVRNGRDTNGASLVG